MKSSCFNKPFPLHHFPRPFKGLACSAMERPIVAIVASALWHDSHSFVLVDGSRALQGYGVLIGSRFKSLSIGSPSGLRPHQGSGLREWPST